MSLFLLLSAVLFGTITPLDFPRSDASSRVLALEAGEYAVVAMIPDNVSGHAERVNVLSAAAEEVAATSGRYVVLTDDLLAYLSIKRMLTRGISEYERRALASRLSKAEGGLYRASPPKTA